MSGISARMLFPLNVDAYSIVYMAPRECGEAPYVSVASDRGLRRCIEDKSLFLNFCVWCGVLAFTAVSFFVLVLRVRSSRVSSLASPSALGLCAVVSFFAFCYWCVPYSDRASKLTIFLEFCGNIANLASPVCRVWKEFRAY